MEAIIRALAIYLFLLLIMRISGRRTLAQMTNFDMILVLIISEATQQALLGEDFSIINSFLVIITLVGTDIILSLLKLKFPSLSKVIDGVPTVLLKDGKPIEERLKKARVDEDEILESARINQGIGTMDEIKYAVLEIDGDISIIPKEKK
jgi:uncharacterized membrane protein YcaP (DUF421 family)